jgi:hypothetical protein
LYERAGVQLTLHTHDRGADELVTAALAGLQLQAINRARGIKLSVTSVDAGNAWRLQDHSTDLRRKLESSGDLIYHLSDRMVFHIADKAQGKHCLHAAAVCESGSALVIPANSGAGKSSLTAWLVANQFEYLTDELILIDDTYHIEGIARPIQIKAAGLGVIEPLLDNDAQIYPGSLANAVPASSLGGVYSTQSEVRIGAILFPRYRAGAGYELKKLSSAEAGMQLMSNHVNARNLQDHGFRAMMQLIRDTQCFKLEYGGFDHLPADFSSVISGLLT